MQLECCHCHKTISVSDRVGFREVCLECQGDLHCCHQCGHFDAKVYNECREPQADRVLEKNRANYCEFFVPAAGHGQNQTNPKADLLAQAEALFKKPK